MTTKTKKIVSLTAVMLLAGWYVAQSAPVVVGEYTFDSDMEGWTADSGLAEWNNALPGSDGGYLELDFNTGGQSDWLRSPGDPTLYATFPENWLTMDGAYSSEDILGATIRFDFYAEDSGGQQLGPDTLMPYITMNGHTWMRDMTAEVQAVMTPGVAPQWHTFEADALFSGSGSWYSTTGGTSSDWATGFENVTEVGFYLVHTTGDDLYAFDNIGLLAIPVPEPGSMMMLGSALLSLTLTFRKKIGVRARELMKS